MTAIVNIEEEFAAALAAHGLTPAEIIGDGRIHRCRGPEDKGGKQSAWYVFFADGIGGGAFGDWKSGLRETWRGEASAKLTPGQRKAWEARIAERRAAEEAERAHAHTEAAAAVSTIWDRARDASADNPYCTRKRVRPYGLKEFHDRHTLIVPIRKVSGELVSLQFIDADGTKRFKTGGELAGCCYQFGGDPAAGVLLIGEGFATCASAFDATRQPVACAFNAGNLLAVARAWREKLPGVRIVLLADDDNETAGNPGMTRATEAARAVGGTVAVPDFGSDRPHGATDFNDMAALRGLEAVRAAIRRALYDDSPSPPQPEPPRSAVMLACAASIKPEAISWLWPNWLPRGKLSILAGSPGAGKTTLAIAMAAIVTTAGTWPDGSRCERASHVIFWSGEDDPADTLVPRLMAAGADLNRVHFVRSVADESGELRPFDPASDIPLLGMKLEEMGGASLLVVDPLVSAVSGDAHRVNDVRRDLQALVDMAARYGCAVLGISHFAKGTKGSSPAERVIGSQAFVAVSRVVLVAGKDEAAERRILARAKSNIAPDDGGVSYTLEQVETDGIAASRVVWGELIHGTAREILSDVERDDSADDDEKSERDEATEFLRSLLSDGPVPVRHIKADATGAGHSWRTIERAKRELGAQARKLGVKEGWAWVLPDEDRQGRHEENQDRRSLSGGGLRVAWRSSPTTGVCNLSPQPDFPEDRQDRHGTESDGVGRTKSEAAPNSADPEDSL
ncbi:AAA family ATPase [Paraburkholderia sacchari]|uniref:AAA family ATPase n=1 Tax=Paraburkholderia sacchari TaxID=159450 RepID=UPI003D98F6C0